MKNTWQANQASASGDPDSADIRIFLDRWGKRRGLTMLATAASFALLIPVAQNAMADTVSAGGGVSVRTTPGGVELIDIANPNGKGLSHNTYERYNVGANGQVLNNNAGQGAVDTHLAGAVDRNGNLTHSASVILNEVVGSSRSALNGQVEVAGSKADVIVANQAGITCGGCGFVNTDRVTLTTGKPDLAADGNLQGFRVEQGNVEINDGGLAAEQVPVLDIISRSVRIDGPLRGDTVNITTGANRVDYQTGAATPIQGVGDVPAAAIDSSALGGMYANKIRLISTERGVGVNMQGDAAANGGEFTLSANGQIVLANHISATKDVNIAGQNAAASIHFDRGSVESRGNLDVASAGDIVAEGASFQAARNGSLKAGGDLTVDASTTTQHQTRSYVAADTAGNPVNGRVDQTRSTISGSRVDVGSDLVLSSGKATTIAASEVAAQGKVSANAGTNFNLIDRQDRYVETTTETTQAVGLGGGTRGERTLVDTTSTATTKGATLTGGEGTQVTAGNDLLVRGSQTNANLAGGASLSVIDGSNTQSHDRKEVLTSFNVSHFDDDAQAKRPEITGELGDKSITGEIAGSASAQRNGTFNFIETTVDQSTETNVESVASRVAADRALSLKSGGDILIRGSDVASKGDLSVAGASVQVLAGTQRKDTLVQHSKTSFGVDADLAAGIKGKVSFQGDADSTLSLADLVNLEKLFGAGTKVSIDAAGTATSSANAKAELFLGAKNTTATATHSELTQRGSTLQSGGDLSLAARDTALLSGATLSAGNDLTVRGANIDNRAVVDVIRDSTKQESHVGGLFLTANGAATANGALQGNTTITLIQPPSASGKGQVNAQASGEVAAGLRYQNETTETTDTQTSAFGNTLLAGGDITRSAALTLSDEATQANAGGNFNQTAFTMIDRAVSSGQQHQNVHQTHDAVISIGAKGAGQGSASGASDNSLPVISGQVSGSAGVGATYTGNITHSNDSQSKASVSSYQADGNIASTSKGSTYLTGTRFDAGGTVALNAYTLDFLATADTQSQVTGQDAIHVAGQYNFVGAPLVVASYQGVGQGTDVSTAVVGSVRAKDGIELGSALWARTLGTTFDSGKNIRIGATFIDLGAATTVTATTDYALQAGIGWNGSIPVATSFNGKAAPDYTFDIGLGGLPVKLAAGGQLSSDVATQQHVSSLKAAGDAEVSAFVGALTGLKPEIAGRSTFLGILKPVEAADTHVVYKAGFGLSNDQIQLSIPHLSANTLKL